MAHLLILAIALSHSTYIQNYLFSEKALKQNFNKTIYASSQLKTFSFSFESKESAYSCISYIHGNKHKI